jgi:protein gp37
MNFWIGCTKVGPGCDHCYAVNVGARSGVGWGRGEPRRLTSEHNRNSALRWQKKAGAFLAEHGHPRRVFCSSLADVFDNEVPDEWRAEAFDVMENTPDLRWQICTKRVSNIEKMVPEAWHRGTVGILKGRCYWPQNVGILITVVTPEEVLRDVPRLVDLKRRFGIPWIGLSIEPMIADVSPALERIGCRDLVDWIILGGESGPHARPCDIGWMRLAIAACEPFGPAIFIKQMGHNPTYGGEPLSFTGKGADPSEWPGHLRLHEFPAALRQ